MGSDTHAIQRNQLTANQTTTHQQQQPPQTLTSSYSSLGIGANPGGFGMGLGMSVGTGMSMTDSNGSLSKSRNPLLQTQNSGKIAMDPKICPPQQPGLLTGSRSSTNSKDSDNNNIIDPELMRSLQPSFFTTLTGPYRPQTQHNNYLCHPTTTIPNNHTNAFVPHNPTNTSAPNSSAASAFPPKKPSNDPFAPYHHPSTIPAGQTMNNKAPHPTTSLVASTSMLMASNPGSINGNTCPTAIAHHNPVTDNTDNTDNTKPSKPSTRTLGEPGTIIPQTTILTRSLLYQFIILCRRYRLWLRILPELQAHGYFSSEQRHEALSFLSAALLESYFSLCLSRNNATSPDEPLDFTLQIPTHTCSGGKDDTNSMVDQFSKSSLSQHPLATEITTIGSVSPPVAGGLVVPLNGWETVGRSGLLKLGNLTSMIRRILIPGYISPDKPGVPDYHLPIGFIERITWANPHGFTYGGVVKIIKQQESVNNVETWMERRQTINLLVDRYKCKGNADNVDRDLELCWFFNRFPDSGPKSANKRQHWESHTSRDRSIWDFEQRKEQLRLNHIAYDSLDRIQTELMKSSSSPRPIYSGSIDGRLMIANNVGGQNMTLSYPNYDEYVEKCQQSYTIVLRSCDEVKFEDDMDIIDENGNGIVPPTVEMVLEAVEAERLIFSIPTNIGSGKIAMEDIDDNPIHKPTKRSTIQEYGQ